MLTLALLASLVTAQADDAPYARPLESLSRSELQLEYARLEEQRPSLVGAITLTAVGGGVVVAGGAWLLSLAVGRNFTGVFSGTPPLGYIFVVTMLAGAALFLPSLWQLVVRRQERAPLSRRMDLISERLEDLQRPAEEARERPAPRRAAERALQL